MTLVLSLVACGTMVGQRPRRGPQQPAATAGAYNMPAVTFRGVLKELNAKLIVIESEDGQPVTIYRNRKTRFLKGDVVVDAKQFEPGMKVTVDVAKNPDASLLAVAVMIMQPAQ